MTKSLADDYSAKFLQASINALREKVVPAIDDPVARIYADLITRALCLLQRRNAHRGADLQKLLAEDEALLREITALIPAAANAEAASARSGPAFSAVDEMERALYAEDSRVCAAMPALFAEVGKGGAKGKDAANILRRIVDTQQAFMIAQDPDIVKGSYVCYQGGYIEQERTPPRPALLGAEITEASLTAHLQAQFPGCRIENMKLLVGGFSKSTVLFTLVHADGKSEDLVLRKDLPVWFNSTVDEEFKLLQKVHQAGFPVAEPLWVEEDPKPFGGRFLVSRRVGGGTDTSAWAKDKQSVDHFARQLTKVMADLHKLDLEQLGYPAELCKQSAGDLMRIEIERWRKIFTDSRCSEYHPLIELSLAWLEANIPAPAFERPASLIHGDIGFHNLMIENGKVTALLDWEFSHLGDPIEELIYTKPFIEKVMDWETFKSRYREYSGLTCTAEEEFFYTVWSKTRSPADGVLSGQIFENALPHDIKYGISGKVLARYLEFEAARMIVDSL